MVAALFMSGCLSSGGSLTNSPTEEFTQVNLYIRLGKVDATAPSNGEVDLLQQAAAKRTAAARSTSEEIVMRDMVVRFTSNLKDTVWDTVELASSDVPAIIDSALTGSDDGHVVVDVQLAPLRWWNIEIKTHDMNDSVIHYALLRDVASKGGQAIDLEVPVISSRFSLYEASYVLPDKIYPANVPETERVYQKIFFNRLVLAVDSVIVRDSTSFSPAITSAGSRFITADTNLRGGAGKFFFRPTVSGGEIFNHVQIYPYVRTGPRVFTIRAYGFLEGDSVTATPRLLFQGNTTLSITPGATITAVPVKLEYSGPGSKSDTTGTGEPNSENWTGIHMSVLIGKTGMVVQPIEISGEVEL